MYGSAVAPVGTSAPGKDGTFLWETLTAFYPVPDDALSNNDVLTSYDSYDPPVIDLTNSEDQDNTIIDLRDSSVSSGTLGYENLTNYSCLCI